MAGEAARYKLHFGCKHGGVFTCDYECLLLFIAGSSSSNDQLDNISTSTLNRNFYRYESPDESCYSESVLVGEAAREKKRRRRKADVEASSKVGTMLTMMRVRCR